MGLGESSFDYRPMIASKQTRESHSSTTIVFIPNQRSELASKTTEEMTNDD